MKKLNRTALEFIKLSDRNMHSDWDLTDNFLNDDLNKLKKLYKHIQVCINAKDKTIINLQLSCADEKLYRYRDRIKSTIKYHDSLYEVTDDRIAVINKYWSDFLDESGIVNNEKALRAIAQNGAYSSVEDIQNQMKGDILPSYHHGKLRVIIKRRTILRVENLKGKVFFDRGGR